MRPSGKHERRALRHCRRQSLGIGVPVSQVNSVYHQMFHAVPTWLAQHERVAEQAATFVPLTFASAAIGRGKPANPRRWHGWEFSLRALTGQTPEEIVSTTTELLQIPCVCFERFETHAPAFNPGAPGSAANLRLFRDAALRNARTLHRIPASPVGINSAGFGPGRGQGVRSTSSQDMLLVSRMGGRRAISNERALLAAVQAVPRLRRVVLEELTLSEQMLLVASATTMIAVHGQALAWVPFLPSERQATAVVEMVLSNTQKRFNDCYQVWCGALGVRYYRVAAKVTMGCTGGVTSRDNAAARQHKLLHCNVTADVAQATAAIMAAAARTARR